MEEELRQLVTKLRPKSKAPVVIGKVTKVTGDTCAVDEYEEVRLNAIIATLDSQITVYPKLGSMVAIQRLENEDDYMLTGYSEIDRVLIKIGQQEFEMKNNKFKMKFGNVSLKAILNNGFTTLKNAIITTPSGPGSFSPADKQKFQQYNNQINQLFFE